tara:strand:- start:659 stop:1795 length:1137 start_codon:yes stop_codon:yes gene_type:complete
MTDDVMQVAEAPAGLPDTAERLLRGLGAGPFAVVIVFVSPHARVDVTMRRLSVALSPSPVIGCTTAGEIGRQGYAEDSVIAIALPARLFRAAPLLIADLGSLDAQAVIGDMIRARGALMRQAPDWAHEFAFLMVDGLSTKEDALAAALAPGLGSVPLFGGSAADGARFLQTFVYFQGRPLRNAAVLTMIRSACPVRVFKFDHFEPTAQRMVVTGADPLRRLVQSINAEPAALEYARLLGKDPGQLTPFTFAAHPVVVRLGGQHHVRSIRQVDENGDLVFFSAIDEGMVLTLAEPQDVATHLAHELDGLAQPTPPAAILACDCVLRRIEVQEKQMTAQISTLLRAHDVVGFSTYGEQLNSMHVNQTMTGVAIYPPPPAT